MKEEEKFDSGNDFASLENIISLIRPASRKCRDAAFARWQSLAKPLGGLGLLEDAVCKISAAQRLENPRLSKKALAVFCADNGIVSEGVSQTGSEVTSIIAEGLCLGRAAVCKMAQVAGCEVYPVDMGMFTRISHSAMRNFSVDSGTKNFAVESAMTKKQCVEAILNGAKFAAELAGNYDIFCVGEAGIGNTTTSSAVVSSLLEIDPERITGKGAGLSDEGLKRKINVIRQAAARLRPEKDDAIDVLSKVGGFDIAGMCGFILGAAQNRVPVILDGFISCASALCAQKLCPNISDYLLASHESSEPGSEVALKALRLSAPVHAGMHLGEGTGAVAFLPLLEMSLKAFSEMPTFEQIKMTPYKPL